MIFKKEFVAYRLVDQNIISMTDSIEIKDIEDSIKNPYEEVQRHVSKTLDKLSDYKNSIEESISSVESMVKLLTQNEKGTLGQGLKYLEDRIPIFILL